MLGRDALADQLLADFWLRQSLLARHAERRSDALLYALQALPTEAARAALAELIGDDYRQLERNFGGWQTPPLFAVDWVERRLVGIDAAQRAQALDLEPRAGAQPAVTQQATFSALEYRPLLREIPVASSGSAGEFELVLEVQHASIGELLVTLAAPSGAQANVIIPQTESGSLHSFIAADASPLAALADEDREGRWRLTIVDQRADNSGTLLAWALHFADEEPARDAPEGGVAIADPLRTEDVTVELGANGRFAIVRPTRAGSVGTVALWDLRAGRLQADLQLPAPATYAELNADASRLLVVAGGALIVWNVAEGVPVARLATQTEFVLPPALSPDGGYVMIAERVEEAAPLFSLLRAADGQLLTSVAGVAGVNAWFLGPEARFVALLGDTDELRVLDPRRGGEPRSLEHPREIRRVLPLATAATLLTVDAAGDVREWDLGAAPAAAAKVLGTTVDPATVSVAAAGTRVAYVGGRFARRRVGQQHGRRARALDRTVERAGDHATIPRRRLASHRCRFRRATVAADRRGCANRRLARCRSRRGIRARARSGRRARCARIPQRVRARAKPRRPHERADCARPARLFRSSRRSRRHSNRCAQLTCGERRRRRRDRADVRCGFSATERHRAAAVGRGHRRRGAFRGRPFDRERDGDVGAIVARCGRHLVRRGRARRRARHGARLLSRQSMARGRR